jgi:hypothetical protein
MKACFLQVVVARYVGKSFKAAKPLKGLAGSLKGSVSKGRVQNELGN